MTTRSSRRSVVDGPVNSAPELSVRRTSSRRSANVGDSDIIGNSVSAPSGRRTPTVMTRLAETGLDALTTKLKNISAERDDAFKMAAEYKERLEEFKQDTKPPIPVDQTTPPVPLTSRFQVQTLKEWFDAAGTFSIAAAVGVAYVFMGRLPVVTTLLPLCVQLISMGKSLFASDTRKTMGSKKSMMASILPFISGLLNLVPQWWGGFLVGKYWKLVESWMRLLSHSVTAFKITVFVMPWGHFAKLGDQLFNANFNKFRPIIDNNEIKMFDDGEMAIAHDVKMRAFEVAGKIQKDSITVTKPSMFGFSTTETAHPILTAPGDAKFTLQAQNILTAADFDQFGKIEHNGLAEWYNAHTGDAVTNADTTSATYIHDIVAAVAPILLGGEITYNYFFSALLVQALIVFASLCGSGFKLAMKDQITLYMIVAAVSHIAEGALLGDWVIVASKLGFLYTFTSTLFGAMKTFGVKEPSSDVYANDSKLMPYMRIFFDSLYAHFTPAKEKTSAAEPLFSDKEED